MSNPDIPSYITMVMKTLLSALPGTLGGSLAGYYFARRMEGARRKDRIKEDHLRELKLDLLQILKTRLAEFYSPICNGQSGPVERLTDQVRKKTSSITDDPYVRTDFILSIRPVRAESPQVTEIFQGRPPFRLVSESFEKLYEDASQAHYPELLGAWGQFFKDFEAASQKHLEFTKRLVADLKKALGLPALIASSSNDPVWASYESLALFIYHHHLGTNQWHLTIYDHQKLNVCASGSQDKLVQCATPENARDALAAITAIAKKTDGAEEMLHAFDRLRPKVANLATGLESALANTDLPKSCRYC